MPPRSQFTLSEYPVSRAHLLAVLDPKGAARSFQTVTFAGPDERQRAQIKESPQGTSRGRTPRASGIRGKRQTQ
jgi:hypothetical protein